MGVRVVRPETGVGTAMVRVPRDHLDVVTREGARIGWGTRVQVVLGGGQLVTMRALVESSQVAPAGVDPVTGERFAAEIQRSVRLVPIRAERNDPDLYPQQPKPVKTGGSRKARKLARQRAANWAAR